MRPTRQLQERETLTSANSDRTTRRGVGRDVLSNASVTMSFDD